MAKEKLCPIVKDYEGNLVDCGEDICGWWDGQKCAIMSLPVMVWKLEDIKADLVNFNRFLAEQ